jgi:hypothetical protein
MAVSSFRLEHGDYRRQFADFLDRLASGSVDDVEEWSSFIVTHYPDEFLEELRRCTVRLCHGRLGLDEKSVEGQQTLRAWALALRSEWLYRLNSDGEDAAG